MRRTHINLTTSTMCAGLASLTPLASLTSLAGTFLTSLVWLRASPFRLNVMSASMEDLATLVGHEVQTTWTSERLGSQSEFACTSGTLRAARTPAALSANLSCASCHYDITQYFFYFSGGIPKCPGLNGAGFGL
jgi:hypothetical protein